jgi:Spy/CpxP family protein refolding chaperone
MKSRVGIALSWILVFILGAVAGAVSLHIYQRYLTPPAVRPLPPPKPESIVDGMARELKLNDQQKDQLKSIFDQSRERYLELGKQYRAIRKETDEEIKKILNPEQKTKFEEFLKQVSSRRQSRRSPPPPPQKQP